MATKTITIDLEAYERLSDARRGNESFTEVIKRIIPRRLDLEAWLAAVEEAPMSTSAVRAVEEQIARRGARSRQRR